ncbi:MAG: hypothetical protein KF805_13865 [Phycisphaeraceae bacterium]|nr:hypothetical protein [Phycisphaeraceae bacterium]
MTDVQEAKSRLLDWAKQSDTGPSMLPSGLGPALGIAAAGVLVGHLLPGKRQGRSVASSILSNAFSLATLVPIARTLLPILLKKL